MLTCAIEEPAEPSDAKLGGRHPDSLAQRAPEGATRGMAAGTLTYKYSVRLCQATRTVKKQSIFDSYWWVFPILFFDRSPIFPSNLLGVQHPKNLMNATNSYKVGGSMILSTSRAVTRCDLTQELWRFDEKLEGFVSRSCHPRLRRLTRSSTPLPYHHAHLSLQFRVTLRFPKKKVDF